MPKLLSPKPFPTFFYQLPKIYVHFQNKNKIFNETWYIWL